MLSSNLPFNYDAMLDNLAGEFGEHDVDYLDSDSIISGTQTPTSTYSYAKLKAKINDEVEIKKILKGMDKILELDAILVKKNEVRATD